MEDAEQIIVNSLESGIWKEFIDEKGTDWENATLTTLKVDHIQQTRKAFHFSVTIKYSVLEDDRESESDGIAVISKDGEIQTITRAN